MLALSYAGQLVTLTGFYALTFTRGEVTVAIPVRNGGALFERQLAALARQTRRARAPRLRLRLDAMARASWRAAPARA